MMMDPERAATALLLRQRLTSLAIDVKALRYDQSIHFDTMQHFCTITRVTMETMQQYSPDGITLRRQIGGKTQHFVLYNQNVQNLRRRNFTLAHEVGHICLGHEDDSDRQEEEANTFAAQLLLPRVLVRQWVKNWDGQVAPEDLCDVFFVSRSVAETRLRRLADSPATDEADYKLLHKLQRLLPDRNGPILSW